MQLVSEFPGFAADSASMDPPASLSVMDTVPVVKESPAFQVVPTKAAEVSPTATAAITPATANARSTGRRTVSATHRFRQEFQNHRGFVSLVPARGLSRHPGSKQQGFGLTPTNDEGTRPVAEGSKVSREQDPLWGGDLHPQDVVEVVKARQRPKLHG